MNLIGQLVDYIFHDEPSFYTLCRYAQQSYVFCHVLSVVY